MFTRATITWLLCIPVAIGNAAVRESVVKPELGELRAHQVSSLTGSAAMFTVIFLMYRNHVQSMTNRQLWTLGFGWVTATIAFEFGAGHYLFGNSWQKLFADYNLFNGRIWSLVLTTLLVAPTLTKKLSGRRNREESSAARFPVSNT
jgi:hypothetical protein